MDLIEREKSRTLSCILLIGDDISSNYLHQMTIRSCGFEHYIHTSRSAEEALEFLSFNTVYQVGNDLPRPGLIILDANLPRMGANDFVEEFRKLPFETQSNCMITLTTAVHDIDNHEHIKHIPEITKVLPKPLSKDLIEALIQEYHK